MWSSIFGRNKNTLRKAKAPRNEEMADRIQKQVMATLGNSAGMREAVKLPKGEDENEWLAVNAVDFFNEINLMYATVEDKCTKQSCPHMTAGKRYTYLWKDDHMKVPIDVPAHKYIELMFEWVESKINNENIFPVDNNGKFPKNFRYIIQQIFKRYFRVYGHVYHHHLAIVESIGAEAHLNTCFKHFLYFVEEFNLVSAEEMNALADVIERLRSKDELKE